MKLTYLPEFERIHIKADSNNELRGIKNWLTRKPENFMFDPRFKMKLWDGNNTKYDKPSDTIPMGLWKEAYKCCEEFGYTFEFTNKDEFPINRDFKKKEFYDFIDDFFKDYKIPGTDKIIELRDYQKEAALAILKDRYCNIAVATSGGKTLIYSMVIFFLIHKYGNKNKFLLVVPSKTLVTQFYDDLLDFNQGKLKINVQEIFDETEKPRTTNIDKSINITIGTFQSLSTNDYDKQYFQQFYSVTLDEAHKSKSSSYKKICKKTFGNAFYRWGMSGSFPKDESEEMMQIMSHTGPVCATVKAKKLMDEGFITKVKIKGVLMYHNDWEFVEQLAIVASRDKKSAYDLEVAKAQDSEEKLSVINKIVSQCKSNTLVLFHNTEYGQKIFDLLKEQNPNMEFYYIDGSVKNNGNSKNIINNRTYIKKQMEKTGDGIIRILCASFGTLSVGVSINAITNVIFTQSFKKPQVIIQAIGRALRLHPDKKMAYIFDLVDVFNVDSYASRVKNKFKNILYNHWEKRLAIYCEEEYPATTIEIQLKPA